MSRATGRRLLPTTIAVGLVLSLAGIASAAPAGMLKQVKVPTARSQPRAITPGADGNIWFTEGTEFTGAPAKLGRVTPSRTVTEFGVECNFCILTDLVQGPDDVLYATSNNPILVRFDVGTLTQLPSIDIPDNNAVAGSMDVAGDEVWFTDFNNDSLWRYDISADQFTEFPVAPTQPSDVVVDSAGAVWFTAPDDHAVDRLDPATGTVTSYPVPDGLSPRSLDIATDGRIWFTSRFTPQGLGRLDPATGAVTTFLTPSNPGPEEIAASPTGVVWFAQTTRGNIASITDDGVISETKAVKNSGPLGIAVAPDGNPWFTMTTANKIGTVLLR